MNLHFRWPVVLALCLAGISVRADQLAVGAAVPAVSAKDQHGTEFNLTTNVQFLLVATEMECAKAANRKLAEQGAGYLEKHHAAYLMDIHTMPAVGRFFALPKMKKYPHRIVLVDSADTLAAYPVQPGRVTVLSLSTAGRIQKISFWNPDLEPVTGCFQ